MNKIYDVAVIGGGPAGYVAAIRAAQLGGSVILFEKDVVGGTCLNRGCIPTKTYIKTAEYIHNIKHAGDRGVGIDVSTLTIDMPRIVANKNAVVKQLTGGVAGLLRANKVEVIKGVAKMASETKIECEGQTYEAKSTLLCGGSVAGLIPIPGLEGNPDCITSDEVLELTEVPGAMVVIGGGVIGCEIATAFSSFGADITIVELADRLVPTMDAQVSEEVKKGLERLGVKVMLSQKVEKIEKQGGKTAVVVEGGESFAGDKVLLSIGRQADLECLGALKDTISVERGKVKVDDHMRTSIPNVYAPGDINGLSMLAHAAFKMGEAAAANALGHDETCNLSHVPGCLYTIPEAASVGFTEEQAKKRYGDVNIGFFPLSANGRSLASGESGFIKVIADKKYGEILGVHMVGGVATEMISEPTSLMEMEITVNEVADIIHAHPTYSEAFMEACADALGRCLHLPPKK